MAAEVATAASVLGAVSQAKTTFYDPLRQKISNSKRLEEVHEALKYAIDSLVSIRDELEIEVQNHKATKRPSKPYITWVGKVQKIEDEVEGFETPYGVQIKKSKYWSFSSRSKLSDKMKEKASAVIRLLEEERLFRSILVDREPERVVKMTPPDIKDFPTLQRPLEQILVWLKEDGVKGIRVDGALGTGITTIMRNLNNHSQVFETFGVVIWLKVSTGGNRGNISTQELQQAIARRLMIRDINGVDEVAKAIRDSLKDKKYLLLLDDVRQDLNMDDIGIPETQGSKIVLTTTMGHFCNSMVEKVIKVGKFSADEALKLFQYFLNFPNLRDNPHIERYLRKVVQVYDFHSLRIKLAATAFKVRGPGEEWWREGYSNLIKWSRKGDHPMKKMFELLRDSCDNLNDDQKDCFLYGTLYPEGTDTYEDCLLDCWSAQDFLGSNVDVDKILHLLKMMLLPEEGAHKPHQCNKFQVFIDCKISNPQIPTPDRYNRFVKYCNGKWNDPPIFTVLDKADAVELFNHEHQFLSDFETVGMNQVQHCQVESWKNIRSIVNGRMNCLTLGNMERLYMKDFARTGKYLEGALNAQLRSLSNLKTLVLIKCPKLNMILSDGVIQQLSKIQHLEIRSAMELKILSVSPQWPSLEKLKISGCPSVNELPFTNSNPRKLISIEVDRVWWEKLNWQELQVKERLSALLPPRAKDEAGKQSQVHIQLPKQELERTEGFDL
ncbi:hypothetical protein RJ640_000226 [Escallonia rubra]|uniref:NB-ARC domain-containing protein n=1 Tax=Escallonia rubra TaxID=112253 RepID=A0AA88RH62_9ASTE|nr:hypothetical protein RJ640_000226 [Escallonia rubra]